MIMFITQSAGEPDPGTLIGSILFVAIAVILSTLIYFGWFWSTGVGLQRFVPKSVNLAVGKFKFFLLFQLIYLLIILAVFIPVMINTAQPSPMMFLLMLPIHFFSIFCMFYCMYFIAKTIKTVELQRPVSFGDYIGDFFLIMFYFIGVWILQPKINRMATENREQDPNSIFTI
jgi:predicted permease